MGSCSPLPSFFISPAKPGKLIWDAGPAFVIPTGGLYEVSVRSRIRCNPISKQQPWWDANDSVIPACWKVSLRLPRPPQPGSGESMRLHHSTVFALFTRVACLALRPHRPAGSFGAVFALLLAHAASGLRAETSNAAVLTI